MEQNELMAGLTSEEMSAVFFNANALQEPAYRLYRLDGNNYRYYYRFTECGDVEFYPSVTTMLGQVMPTSPHLIDWMLEQGKEQAIEKRDLAAAYGTFMHGELEKLAINREYDFGKTGAALLEYIERENLPVEKVFGEWAEKIRKDVLSFAQFMQDWQVKPFAIEVSLYHPQYGYAGCVDMVCEMEKPNAKKDANGKVVNPEDRFLAIVDFKSGRKGFWESHELQLHLYKSMVEANFNIPIERVFNFSPKDWRKKPTYNLKDQTEAESAKKIPHLLALAMIADKDRDNEVVVVDGKIRLDESLEGAYKTITLSELIKSKADTGEKAPESGQNGLKFEPKPKNKVEAQPEGESGKKTATTEAVTDLGGSKPEADLPWEREEELFNDINF